MFVNTDITVNYYHLFVWESQKVFSQQMLHNSVSWTTLILKKTPNIKPFPIPRICKCKPYPILCNMVRQGTLEKHMY